MKSVILFLFAAFAGSQAVFAAGSELTLGDVAARLSEIPEYAAEASFVVSMPQMPDDVAYDLRLGSRRVPADTLAPCDYLIDWILRSGNGDTRGFSSYFDGNHYRYNGENRLLEYHIDWDPSPFADCSSPGRYSPGIQRSAQFANFLPGFIADDFRRWSSDPSYSLHVNADTVVGGEHRVAVVMRRVVGGETVGEGVYLFDSATMFPVSVDLENNPGSLSEQTVAVRYGGAQPEHAVVVPASEEALIELYPDVFGRFRTSTFRVESLVGEPLPAFSLPTVGGERFSRGRRDRMPAPTAVLIFDPVAGFASEMIADLRAAASELPYAPMLIFAAMSTNADQIESLLPAELPGERRLMSANGFARDCGVAVPPVLLLVDRSGNIVDVTVGYNKNLRLDVIQKMSVLTP